MLLLLAPKLDYEYLWIFFLIEHKEPNEFYKGHLNQLEEAKTHVDAQVKACSEIVERTAEKYGWNAFHNKMLRKKLKRNRDEEAQEVIQVDIIDE